MSAIDRPLSGDTLTFDLEKERALALEAMRSGNAGRGARTLLKEGALRVTLIVIAPGGGIPEHHASGPILVQVLDGSIEFSVGAEKHALRAGQLLSVAAGLRHSVQSPAGGAFLLTVSQGSAGAG